MSTLTNIADHQKLRARRKARPAGTRAATPVGSNEAVDLSREREAFSRALGCTGIYALWGEHLYRLFLMLRAREPEAAMAPTLLIAAFWMIHKANPEKYARDCEILTGHVVVDERLADAADTDAAFAAMRARFEDVYGIDPCVVPFSAETRRGTKVTKRVKSARTFPATGLTAEDIAALNGPAGSLR
ncbi:MAG: hypothetical protein AAF638_12640 [Pseudomonadota bacterium]